MESELRTFVGLSLLKQNSGDYYDLLEEVEYNYFFWEIFLCTQFVYLNYYSSCNAIPSRTKLQKKGLIFIPPIRHSKSSEILSETGEKVKIISDLFWLLLPLYFFSNPEVFLYNFNIFEFDT